MSNTDNPNWYTTSQVADILGRSDRFVRDRVKSGELEAMANKGKQRTSYKISAEALASYMVVSRDPVQKSSFQGLLKSCSAEYLRDCLDLFAQELRRKEPVVIRAKSEDVYMPVFELMQRCLPQDFLYGEAPYRKYFDNSALLMSVAFDRVANRAEGVLCAALTTARYYDDLCRNKVREDRQPPCNPGETPAIYLDTLILEDPVWAAYIFRDMRKQIARATRSNSPLGYFTIASDPIAHRLSLKYGFKEVAKYGQSQFPIMMTRDLKFLQKGTV